MGTITSANAVVMLGVGTVFPVPVQIQGFSADDIFTMDDIKNAEILMGVDGILSRGYRFVPKVWRVTLQADSPSNSVFDLAYTTQEALREILTWNGVVTLETIGTTWIMTNGAMTSYKPMPDAKTILQPRTFEITWQSVTPAPTGT